MKLKFYQKEWFGENLEGLAKHYGHKLTDLAGDQIYRAVYQKLLSNQFTNISENWILKKEALSHYLSNILKSFKIEHPHILSVGCGVGIVEHFLIRQGFNIDLQECQDLSIQYLHTKFPEEYKSINFIESLDLKQIDNSCYNVVMAITSTYCLPNTILASFLDSINRITSSNGYFIWYETVLTKQEIINALKNLVRGRTTEGLFWGWKRSTSSMIKLAKQHGFNLVKKSFLDSNNVPLDTNGNWPPKQAAWQMMVFKKND
ncbi:MAG: hypothetical protein K0M45_04885 [Candidatus Paracaedibacteraceae bacterium]|nr:hypothetical protein [Candidatus Paracaedibacteraceae bacterium]